MSRDILLDSNHDIDLVNYDLALTDSTAQRVKQALLIRKGDWFLDANAGLPFYEEIIGNEYDLARIEAIYIAAIQAVEGVSEILSFDISLNTQTRKLSINFEIRDTENNLTEINL